MKETVNKTQFVSRFGDMGRENNFSREGRELLFDWLEEYEEDIGEELEFDVIGLCCEFSEDSLEDINREYSQEFEDIDDAVEWLNDMTIVVGVTSQDTIIFSVF